MLQRLSRVVGRKLRDMVRLKYGGKCAYTGKELEPDWQVDHVISKIKHEWQCYYRHSDLDIIKQEMKKVHDIENLVPALRIVNHYKRSLDLEGFRLYMLNFHKRLAKLPKNTNVESTKSRKVYMQKVAEAFDITVEKPFDGLFYFEKL